MSRYLLLILVVGCTRTGGSGPGPGPEATRTRSDPWPAAAAEIKGQPDAATCRRVLVQLNGELANAGSELPKSPAARLDQFRPSPEAAADFTAAAFTPLDAQYIAESLALHTAARTLDPAGLPPEAQAAIAFGWVCRQVYLRPWEISAGSERGIGPPVPPTFVLRRGYGTGLERASVFLALVRQLGLDGCLLGPPDQDRKPGRTANADGSLGRGPFFAVGVRLDHDVAVFDPFRGTRLPMLSKLRAAPDAEEFRNACAYLAAPLSALTPRMTVLEGKLAAEIGVRLAIDPDAVAGRFSQVPGGVRWWCPPAAADPFCITHGLGSFLPADDGGFDHTPAGPERLYERLTLYEGLPVGQFAPPPELTSKEAALKFQSVVLGDFKAKFVDSGFRDRLLRGQFNEVAKQLTDLDRKYAALREKQRADAGLREEIAEWCRQANAVYAALSLARLPENAGKLLDAQTSETALWKSRGAAAVLDPAIVAVGSAEIAYLLAACKHEQAERAQIRWLKTKGPTTEATAAWAVAKDAWDRYASYAAATERTHPGRAVHAGALAARAARLAGDPTAE